MGGLRTKLKKSRNRTNTAGRTASRKLLNTVGPEKIWPRPRVENWKDFQTEIEKHLDGNWIFRGVGSVSHSLLPSVGRKRDDYVYSRDIELALFEQFKREALPFLPIRPATDWEWLALAQHHGVPTRLLDWSESPYVSLFFAV